MLVDLLHFALCHFISAPQFPTNFSHCWRPFGSFKSETSSTRSIPDILSPKWPIITKCVHQQKGVQTQNNEVLQCGLCQLEEKSWQVFEIALFIQPALVYNSLSIQYWLPQWENDQILTNSEDPMTSLDVWVVLDCWRLRLTPSPISGRQHNLSCLKIQTRYNICIMISESFSNEQEATQFFGPQNRTIVVVCGAVLGQLNSSC